MKHLNGPAILFMVGVALTVVHLAARTRCRRKPTHAEMRAGARLLWDLIVGVATLVVFAGWMLAPRHVLPGQRIPRPKARRMVRAMDADTARKLIR